MNANLSTDGYEIHPAIFALNQIEPLRKEADAVACAAGTTSVRHLRSRSAIFNELALSELLLSLLPPDLVPVRSILFDKTSKENWPVLWHQDLTIALKEERPVPGYGPWSFKDGSPHVQPPLALLANMITIRLHLDETPIDNGALRVVPGSHRLGKVPSATVKEHLSGDRVTCECGPGDVLLMSPLILHSSRRSVSPKRRRVVHFEYARQDDLDPLLQWFE